MTSHLLETMKKVHTRSEYDKSCKAILSSKEILSHILKYIVDETKDLEHTYIRDYCIEGTVSTDIALHANEGHNITGMNTESHSIDEGTISFDIVFYISIPGHEEKTKIIINIESQKDPVTYPIVKRGIYYASRLISSQYGTEFTHSHYEKIKKVYSIWICLNTPKKSHNTIIKYDIMKTDLVGSIHEQSTNYDLMKIIIINIGNPKEDRYTDLIKLLGTLLKNHIDFFEKTKILQDEFSIQLNKKEEEEVKNMCNLSEAIFEDGMNEGLRRGIQQGMQQGMQQAFLLSIQNLMNTQHITVHQALDILGIPKEEKNIYIDLITKADKD